MTVHSFWQQALDENAATTRKLSQLLWPGPDGVADTAGATPLLVSAQATPDMTVKVNAGWAKKSGYLAYNDGSDSTAVTIPTADPFLPRKDYVVVRWYDTEIGDGSAQATVEVLAGAPNATPSPPSLTGKTVQVLALIDVAAATTSISGSAITDLRALTSPANNATVQMVQITSTTIPHGGSSFTKLTGTSTSSANGGVVRGIAGLTLASGVLTMPAGSAGQWELSGQVSISTPSGVTGIAGSIQKNGANILAAESEAGGAGVQTVTLPTREFTLADGDQLNLAGYVFGTADGPTFISSAEYRSFLRLKRVA